MIDTPGQLEVASRTPVASCRVCGSPNGQQRTAIERMYGTGEVFLYFHCDQCKCLQLAEVPDDLSPYYPDDYYSFAPPKLPDSSWDRNWRAWLTRRRNELQLFPKSTPWHHLARRRPSALVNAVYTWYQGCPVPSLSARILDVGCGNGRRLYSMRAIGFESLVGIDPFLRENGACEAGVKLHKTSLEDFDADPFDVIMFHHSLEHMNDHASVFRHVSRLLKPHGACLVRIPLSSSELLDSHGDTWVEWDPPRHLFLHTPESLAKVAKSANLVLTGQFFDSTEFCYWASELYRKDIPLVTHTTGRFRTPAEYFDDQQMAAFRERADRANRNGTASRAGFWFQHAG